MEQCYMVNGQAMEDMTMTMTQADAYARGELAPHYPVPVTMDTAIWSLACQREITIWTVQWFKRKLKMDTDE